MPGRGDGDRGVAKGHVKKRDLDDELRVGLGAANPDAKRRHTADGHGQRDDDDSTSNNSSFQSSAKDAKRYSKSSKYQLSSLQNSSRPSSSLPALQRQHSSKPPNSTGSAAKAPGALGASTASGSSWGTKPGGPGGVFTRQDRPTRKQNPLLNGPPTLPSTSSDASSIPAGSTEDSPATTSKHAPNRSSRSLRYGHQPADGAATGKGSLQNRDGAEHGDNVPPASRVKETKKHVYVNISSDDGSYVDDEDDEDTDDDDDDENAISLPTTRQGSARLRADDMGGNHSTKWFSYDKTPSGKDYHVFSNENSQGRHAKWALFPDGYRVQYVPNLGRSYFPCPVRTCSRRYGVLKKLDRHFRKLHGRSEFNDNQDKKGTLEYIGQRRDAVSGKKSLIVSQKPRFPPVLANGPPVVNRATTKNRTGGTAAIATAMPDSARSNVFEAATVNGASEGSPGLRLDGSSSSGNDEQENFSTNTSELERALAQSKVWACIAPLIPQNWTASITDGLETIAFIQAISLPLRNKLDTLWLTGIKNSHQRAYRALMSVILQVIGVDAYCKPCESRVLEKRRNCKVLPPGAAGMRELQEVYGSQCVNCYFFHATRPCEFPASPPTMKETPIPIPILPFLRPIANVERSLDPPAAERPPPAASRPQARTYSLYKASKGETPISQSPVPIPSFASREANDQSQSSHIGDMSLGTSQTELIHQSRHGIMTDFQSAGRNSDGVNDKADEAVLYSTVSVASNTGPSEAALTPSGLISSGQSTKESTVATSHMSPSEDSRSQLVARAFSLFGDIGRLPVEEQASLWNQMQQMAGILETGATTRPSSTMSASTSLSPGPSAVAEDWEVAPGRIIADDKYQMLSTSFLSRASVSLKAAQQVSTSQWVLNKSIAALNQLSVGHEEGWDCQCSVIRGVLKVKIGDVRTRIGQGGLIIVDKECIITNVSHKEARIQVWWRKADD